MKIAIGTSWYKGVSDEALDRMVKSWTLFEDAVFYLYIDEAPENTKIKLINEILKKYNITCNIIQGHTNNCVYYAKRKLVNNITEKWCCLIDCGDTFTEEFAVFVNTKKLDDNISLYRFGCNCIGSNSMVFTGDEERLKSFENGEHLCTWAKIFKTKNLQFAYSLLPKYKYKFMYGEEDLVIGIFSRLPTKTIKLKCINYYDDGISRLTEIESLHRFKMMLSNIYLTTVHGADQCYRVVLGRYYKCSAAIQKEAYRLLTRYVNACLHIEREVNNRTRWNTPLIEIEKQLFETDNILDLSGIFGADMVCNWLPEDK